MLRWKHFVQAEDDAFIELVDAFTKATGVEGQRSRASPTRTCSRRRRSPPIPAPGLDLFWGLYSLPHLFPQKCVDVTDVADYLGKKYGGWVPSAVDLRQERQQVDRASRSLPAATCMNYRISALKKAGFSEVPEGRPTGFLEYARRLKKNNTPGGFALGHASGDGNGWLHWCLWAHGGNLVDKDDKVIINSPETAKALEYAKALYENFIPGTASWNDASNNKAFLAGEIHWTDNGISIYVAAQGRPDQEGDRRGHGPRLYAGRPGRQADRAASAVPMLALNYTKYPQACKAFIAFMLEADNFNTWIDGGAGLSDPLPQRLRHQPGLDRRPEAHRVPRRRQARADRPAGIGSVGEKAATAIADFVVLDMFANYCTGREDAKGAIAIAERQLKRIYR